MNFILVQFNPMGKTLHAPLLLVCSSYTDLLHLLNGMPVNTFLFHTPAELERNQQETQNLKERRNPSGAEKAAQAVFSSALYATNETCMFKSWIVDCFTPNIICASMPYAKPLPIYKLQT